MHLLPSERIDVNYYLDILMFFFFIQQSGSTRIWTFDHRKYQLLLNYVHVEELPCMIVYDLVILKSWIFIFFWVWNMNFDLECDQDIHGVSLNEPLFDYLALKLLPLNVIVWIDSLILKNQHNLKWLYVLFIL